jgi:hypothetical protein
MREDHSFRWILQQPAQECFLGKPAKVRQTLFMSSPKMTVNNCTVTIILCRVKPKPRFRALLALAYRSKDIVFRFIIE